MSKCITSSESERLNNAPSPQGSFPSWKDIWGDQGVVQSGSLSTILWDPVSLADHPDKGTRGEQDPGFFGSAGQCAIKLL